MGDFNQYLWVKKNHEMVEGPVLEIGSKFYDEETSVDYRSLFSQLEYIGSDREAGANVDVQIDIIGDIEILKNAFGYQSFKTIICCSVLEHIDDIFQASRNISELVGKGGVLFISVPFVWEEHGYPSDYWRFTPEAVKFLFKDFEFDNHRSTISSNISEDMVGMENGLNNFIRPNYMNTAYANESNWIIRKLKRGIKLLTDSKFRYQYVLGNWGRGNEFKKACINMIGIKK